MLRILGQAGRLCDGVSRREAMQVGALSLFGAMTLPHQLVRVLLLEQIYRTMTILSGHPYHRE